MTDLFERGDTFWIADIRGVHFVVINDDENTSEFCDTSGRLWQAEVGDESLHVSEKDSRLGRTVSVENVHFE